MHKNFYLKGFSEFSSSNTIFEMASELTKIGVPKDLMQFIHNLTGQPVPRSQSGMKRGSKLITTPGVIGGDIPAHQDIPLSHDVQVQSKKTGRKRIYDYLTKLPTEVDSDLRLILVNPDEKLVHLITKKTGKTKSWKGYDPNRPEVSQKRGYYMRIITIDQETGEPLAAWRGTISQLLEDVSDNSVLYIMENETRVIDKRETRKEYKMTSDKFIEYFNTNYIKLVNSGIEKQIKKKEEEFNKARSEIKSTELAGLKDRSSIYRSDIPESLKKLIDIASDIESKEIDTNRLKIKLRGFLEYLADRGEYITDPNISWDKVALLEDVIKKHSLIGTCSKFLQYIVTGKTAAVAQDIFTELGLGDILGPSIL